MTSRYILHHAPDNASLVVRLVLLELGQPFECVLLDRRVAAHKAPPYLAINPTGRIPALETDEGVIFETAAILLWLADRHGQLAPRPGDHDRGAFLTWLFYVSNTLHANLRLLFYPEQFTDSDHKALRTGARRNLAECLRLLDREAQKGHPWLNAGDPSVLDYYLACTLRWMQLYGGSTEWFSWDLCPTLYAMAKRIETRSAFITAADAEGLGPTPVTAAHPCNPKEGAAL